MFQVYSVRRESAFFREALAFGRNEYNKGNWALWGEISEPQPKARWLVFIIFRGRLH